MSLDDGDLALWRVDPHFAMELGMEPPRCCVCGGVIRNPPEGWDGSGTLRHMIDSACDWVKNGEIDGGLPADRRET